MSLASCRSRSITTDSADDPFSNARETYPLNANHDSRGDVGRMKPAAFFCGFRARALLSLALAGVFFLFSGCSPTREYDAALVLADIVAGNKPSRWKEVTPSLLRTTYPYQVENRCYNADLYRPGEEALAGLLLIPGAAETGKDDARLVAFANSLARARFNVLVPDLESLRKLQVGPGNVRELVDAFSVLSGPELSPGGRAGMFAFSYAAGPAILAALEPQIRGRVDFIFAVGGYHDLRQVLVFFTTGHFMDEGRARHLDPNEYGKWVFVLGNLNRLADSGDRRRFEAMYERKKVDLDATLDDLAAGLTAEGEALYAFITNRDPQRAMPLMDELPRGIRQDIVALDLADKELQQLPSRLILVHGYDDPIIPYPESRALSRAVPARQARLFLVDGLAHVDLQPGLIGKFRLWRAVSALLAEREE